MDATPSTCMRELDGGGGGGGSQEAAVAAQCGAGGGGGADAAGEFAHIVVYPDMAGLMQHQEWFAKGGWRGRMDYYQMADCTGEAVMTEQVLGRPGA